MILAAAKKQYRARSIADRHRYNAARNRKHFIHNYGCTIEQVGDLAAKQSYRCSICRRKKKLHVDHDHSTGKIRGLLCITCNTALAFVENRWFEKALKYLQISQQKESLCPDATT